MEINLTAQHLFFYKNGSLVVESDFVSGKLLKGLGELLPEHIHLPISREMPY
ncbi:MAG: hypothetical protein ACLS70_16535 [[Clostridium] symbiosum]